jgi:hypothetical protein
MGDSSVDVALSSSVRGSTDLVERPRGLGFQLRMIVIHPNKCIHRHSRTELTGNIHRLSVYSQNEYRRLTGTALEFCDVEQRTAPNSARDDMRGE